MLKAAFSILLQNYLVVYNTYEMGVQVYNLDTQNNVLNDFSLETVTDIKVLDPSAQPSIPGNTRDSFVC